MESNLRVVRVLLPLELVRKMDEFLASNRAGYQTRHELARDALEAMILELTYGAAPEDEASTTIGQQSQVANMPREAEPAPPPSAPAVPSLEHTVLHPRPSAVGRVARPAPVFDADPLFGLHNRDYPSIWAADYLSRRCADGPVPFDSFLSDVTKAAWAFAGMLARLEGNGPTKISALFPQNRENPAGAESVFRSFGVGGYTEQGDGTIRAWGPLFLWRVAGIEGTDEPRVGLTDVGLDFLPNMDGISLEMPHSPDLANRFFEHIQMYAPADWWGFLQVLKIAAKGPTREETISHFREERSDWKESQAATYAAGYIARAREWGLVEPKQNKGRYFLTDFGRTWHDTIGGIQ